jgi:DNA topoisomerase VI subunit B
MTQIKAIETLRRTGSNGQRSGHRLERVTFRTSRELDFFTEKTLVAQTGHEREQWPLVIVKELVDNALDACEEADVPPVIEVVADAASVTIRDNGPGLPESTLRGSMDFTVRVSSREAYVSPTRGAQGNALKTLLPMPWILDPLHQVRVQEAEALHGVAQAGPAQ